MFSNDAPGSTVPVATRMEDTIQTLAGDHTLQAITKPGQIGKDKYECEPPGDKAFSPYVAFNKTIDCDCSSGWQVCPNNAAGPTPSSRLLPSTDYLLNMTGRDTNKEYDRRSFCFGMGVVVF
ncbi:hypothetical protein DPMN_131018 [Dreissena polymorpha]|uniref:Uncharacterized protein n=1 Tax=Dreissena polymorpha TaxID=45954 RepID=A0A9D4H5R7_DREPO|nr:hypothetical protein DPMN_131018 [Dreissena polymorpha]